ncbi:hypothetical protein ACJZ2D_003861 [Fusarium nematophilum]
MPKYDYLQGYAMPTQVPLEPPRCAKPSVSYNNRQGQQCKTPRCSSRRRLGTCSDQPRASGGTPGRGRGRDAAPPRCCSDTHAPFSKSPVSERRSSLETRLAAWLDGIVEEDVPRRHFSAPSPIGCPERTSPIAPSPIEHRERTHLGASPRRPRPRQDD